MQTSRCLVFGVYRLDLHDERLWRGQEVIHLHPKTFAVLCCLATQAGQLVTKDALLAAVWPETVISESVLTVAIRELRRVLGDQARAPRFIETVHGRGYRFIAPVSATTSAEEDRLEEAARHSQPPLFSCPRPFVGRDAELAHLAQWWTAVQQGQRQIGFIVGEPGIGKTALVDAFVAQMFATEDLWVGHGQCIDHYGAGEAYLPVLEALGRLCRGPQGAALIPLLRQYAPSWLVHLPALLAPGDRQHLESTASGVTPARMLRELADALEVLTTTRPLVLVLEDLHWSDHATLEWLAYVVRRRDPARLLILGTYRPVDLIVRAHPLRPLLAEIRQHSQCVELVLDYLSETAVTAYLRQRFGPTPIPPGLPQALHRRTNGNALFLVALVDELVRQQLLEGGPEAWGIRGGLEAVTGIIPVGLRQFIEARVEHLPGPDQALLEAASVVGPTFSVAAVAAGVSLSEEAIDARCAVWARHGQFLDATGTEAWPDGTVAACYRFRHTLYQEVVYARMSAGQRLRLHHQIGVRKEAGYNDQAPTIATELAVHFEHAQEADRAVHYVRHAVDHAMQRSAYAEVIRHCTKGLALLEALPSTSERTQQALALHLPYAQALAVRKGWAAPEVEQVFNRARELSQQLADNPQLYPMLGGLTAFYMFRGQLHTAWEMAQQYLTLVQRVDDPERRLHVHTLLGELLDSFGEFTVARTHFEQAMTLYTLQRSGDRRAIHDAGVAPCALLAPVLWTLGYPEQARAHSQEALARAQALDHPESIALALDCATHVRQHRRETSVTRQYAEALMSLAEDHDFALRLAYGTLLRGWAVAVQGQMPEGLQQIRQGQHAYHATGAEYERPYLLALQAEIYGNGGHLQEALQSLAEAFTVVEHTGERRWEAELHRLRGEYLLAQQGTWQPAAGIWPAAEEAEACFQQALTIARRQQAKSFELRAAMSLSRLWQQQGERSAARHLLAEVYAWFTEGFDTADLQEARALLQTLA
jgi:DNA-binding winged helix-turn-helix (wHTH) protein/predicted ATPase